MLEDVTACITCYDVGVDVRELLPGYAGTFDGPELEVEVLDLIFESDEVAGKMLEGGGLVGM